MSYQGVIGLKPNSSSDNFHVSNTEEKELVLKNQDFRINKVILNQKRQIEILKKKLRSITQLKVYNIEKKTELEKLFLSCVEEVKKEVSKKRALSSVKAKRDFQGNFRIFTKFLC